ncbi:MAG: type II toxin-antitoxin system VapC family toxin [Nanoarchaeota archaeon]
MENKVCLDSDFLIDFLRNKEKAVNWIKKNPDLELATTIITAFELYHGEYKNKEKSNVQRLDNLLQTITLLNLNEVIAKKAGQITAQLQHEGLIVEFRDVLIATTAIINNYSLKTENKKHFERMVQFGLKLI